MDWFYWSTGRELNPRILILQTSALATSPPVLILRPESEPITRAHIRHPKNTLANNKNPTLLNGAGGSHEFRFVAWDFESIAQNTPAVLWQQQRQEHVEIGTGIRIEIRFTAFAEAA